ncbi:hypothetical protein MKZ38_009503 [Zalerion maritima]|uniref:Uncharacterized protein n=1 Tax=Zalerion maritima TaxID=339359 RepID=A0AAD5RT70_9PEZI|nr:hypothetical protein MKZ38_009503 [Zalerion maritima]
MPKLAWEHQFQCPTSATAADTPAPAPAPRSSSEGEDEDDGSSSSSSNNSGSAATHIGSPSPSPLPSPASRSSGGTTLVGSDGEAAEYVPGGGLAGHARPIPIVRARGRGRAGRSGLGRASAHPDDPIPAANSSSESSSMAAPSNLSVGPPPRDENPFLNEEFMARLRGGRRAQAVKEERRALGGLWSWVLCPTCLPTCPATVVGLADLISPRLPTVRWPAGPLAPPRALTYAGLAAGVRPSYLQKLCGGTREEAAVGVLARVHGQLLKKELLGIDFVARANVFRNALL